jgi:CPA2 family monovalent cation:H+ antiporter-2
VPAPGRRGILGLKAGPETRLETGDVVLLLGVPEALAAAEVRRLKGGWVGGEPVRRGGLA